MAQSPETLRYAIWIAVVVIGSLLAVGDRRWIGRPVFGLLLLIVGIGGLITM
jgi:hypothetical protein